MKNTIFTLLTVAFICNQGFSQVKNFIDQPYIETSAKVDTLVTPDIIYLNILITEVDTKGKISVEELENRMAERLKLLGINLEEQLTLSDLSSNFKKYFLKGQDVFKSKSYSLLVHDALTAGKVILELENINISNVLVEKVAYSNIESLLQELKSKAVAKAKLNAVSLTKPLNQKVGNALYISDLGSYSSSVNGSLGRVQMKVADEMERNKLAPLDIGFEKIKVESRVNVKFKLE